MYNLIHFNFAVVLQLDIDFNNVHPRLFYRRSFSQEIVGGTQKMTLLILRHCSRRTTETAAPGTCGRASFYLNEGQKLFILGNNINFALFVSILSFYYTKTIFLKIFSGFFLPEIPDCFR